MARDKSVKTEIKKEETKKTEKTTQKEVKTEETSSKQEAKASKNEEKLKKEAEESSKISDAKQAALTKQGHSYDASKIKVLDGLDAVRKRPAMYIGSTGPAGLHHLVYEVVDNSIDEALAGFCTEINIFVHTDNSVTVEDNGRGIPVDIHETEKVSAAEVVMTKLHAGGKFDSSAYKVSGGLHGVGVSCVNALSEVCDLEIRREGNVYFQRYRRGKPDEPLKIVGKSKKRGTKVTFKPDAEIFDETVYNFDTLSQRLREMAFLNKGIKIIIEDEREEDKKHEFQYEGGIVSFVEYLNKRKNPVHKPIFLDAKKDDVVVEIAMQWNDSYNENIFSFANNINTHQGGTHLSGFKSALTRTLNFYGQKNEIFKKLSEAPTGDDVREGLTAVISVLLSNPQFEGQTKEKLGNSEIEGIVKQAVNDKLSDFLEKNGAIARKILEKTTEATRARVAARNAKNLVRRKSAMEAGTLPGKLADCQENDPKKSEIYIVEGDSAGGSAKQGRDRRNQAILPLKGKILNVEKARFDKMLQSEEIRTLITALGAGIGAEDFNIEKLRYHSIITMCDADVDGSHIKTLLLTFFYRHMPQVIEKGYLYIAQPPLYRVKKGKSEVYLKDDAGMEEYLMGFGIEGLVFKVGQKEIIAKALAKFVKQVIRYEKLLKKLEHKKDSRWVEGLFMASNVTQKTLEGDQKKLDKELDNIAEFVLKKHPDLKDFKVSVEEDPDYESLQVVYSSTLGGVPKTTIISAQFLNSPEAVELRKISDELKELGKGPYTVKAGDVTNKYETLSEVKNFVLNHGREGLYIQRYKGLGEMNPEQLWETTMNPEKRTLLQVRVEDAVEADNIFSVLMGDDVEPRREFIYQNALNVRNLDI